MLTAATRGESISRSRSHAHQQPQPLHPMFVNALYCSGASKLIKLPFSGRKDGMVVAIVRGNGDDAAYSRLRSGYDSGDPDLLKIFDDLAAKHLKVYAGAHGSTT